MPKIGDAYVEVHADLGQFKREMQAAGRGVSREVDVKADTSSLKGFNAELAKTSKSIATTSKDTDKASGSISNFTKRVVTANQGLDLMGKGVALVKFPALISGASYAAQAVNNLAAGASALTGALTPLAGLAAAAPALYGAMGQAAGVIAFSGVSDLAGAVGGLNEKMDKTADEYKQLSEEGQKFARVLNQQKQPLQDIQKAVQRPLFEGMTKGIQSASKNLPVLKSVLVATSEEMGRLAEEAGKFAGREGFGRDMEAVGKNNAQLLGRLGDAGLHFADALRHVMVEARPLVDFLGKSVVKFSEFVEQEAKAGRESGKLRDFFAETKDLLKVLVPTFADLGEGIWNVVRAGKPLGDDILGVLRDSAEEFRKWTESASGKNAIVQWYQDARGPLEQAGKLVLAIGDAFFQVGKGGGLESLLRTLRLEVLPVILDVLEAGKGFGPVFVDAFTETLKALKPFLGATGALTLFVKTLGEIAKAFNWLIEKAPILGQALATALTIKGIGSLFGVGGILGLFGGRAGLTSGGKQAGGLLAGGLLSGLRGAAIFAGGANLASSVVEGDWKGAGLKAGGALLGGLVGALGGPAGAAVGAAVGTFVGDAIEEVSKPSDWATEIVKMPETFKGSFREIKTVFAGLKAEGKNVTVPLIRAWREAGKISLQEAGQMIRALREVNQQAARQAQSLGARKGFGFAELLGEDRKIMKGEVTRVLDQLEVLPPKVRKIALESMLGWARTLREQGVLTQREYKQLVNLTERRFGDVKQQIATNTRGARDVGLRNLADLRQGADKQLDQTEKSARRHGKGIERAISQPYQAAGIVAVEALHSIERNTNSSLKELKQKPINFAIVDGKKTGTSGLQRGGAALVPGRGTGDIVEARLEPGEVVLNRKAVRALGGAGRANRINQLFPRFATGGVAQPPGDPGSEVVQAAYASEVGQFLQKFSMDLTQGYNPGGPSVSPGHLSLSAPPSLDVVPLGGGGWDGLFAQGLKWALSQGMQVGYDGQYGTQSWSGHGEGDHAHIDWKSGGKLGAVVEKIKRVLIEGPDHAAKNIAQGTSDMVVKGANAMLSKIAPAADTVGVGAGAVSKPEMRSLLKAHGMPNWTGWIAMAESMLNPNAVSSAGARGLFQIMPFWGGGDQLFDPNYNVEKARHVLDSQGLTAWDPSRNAGAIPEGWGPHQGQPFRRGGIVQRLRGGGQVNVGGASTAGVSQPINIEDLEFDPAALAAGAVKGHGGESPSTPIQEWFRMMFGTEPVRKMKDIVGGINLGPDRFTNMVKSYGKALDADELATVAQALETEDPITGAITYPLVPGRGDADGSRVAIGGLGAAAGEGWMDIELAELITVRNRILAAIPLVETLTQFVKQRADSLVGGEGSFLSRAKKIYNAAKRAYEQLKRRIGQLETQIQRLEGIKNPSDEQKKRLEQHKAKLQTFKENLPTLKVWMDAANFRVGAVGDVSTAFTEKGTALAGLTTQLKTDGAEDGSWPSLEELQGRTGRAGSIFDVTLEISSALRAAGEAAAAATTEAAGSGPGELETLSADLLQRQLEEERRRRVIAEAQTPVFEQFFGRTFHTGGIVGGVGNQGVTVQAGEGIFTEDQMAAMGGSNVTVVVEDGAVDPNKIRVVVNDELSSVAARATRVGGTKGQKAVYR